MIPLGKLKLFIPLVIALICAAIIPSLAFNIIEPYTGQIVKEKIRIAIPESAIPSEGYVSLYIYGNNFPEIFAGAFNQRNAVTKNGQVIYYWDSKKPYFDIKDPKAMKTLPDGNYTLRIQIHKSNSTENIADKDTENAATVQFTLKNKITTAANFSVSLYNRLDFGQVNTYTITADVSVLDSVGIPIMQELGLGAKWKVIQSVEDVTPDGLRMIRYRIGDTAYTTINGNQTNLYSGVVNKPQLYRIVDKYGNVSVANLFSKQSNTFINDILPVLPSKKVRLDSTWPDKLTVKVEGLTDKIVLKGDAKLESFEWQDGKPCAKIVSNLGGQGSVVLANGFINGIGSPMSARVTTYIDYKAAKMLLRVIDFEFPCVFNSSTSPSLTSPNMGGGGVIPGMEDEGPGPGNYPGNYEGAPQPMPGAGSAPAPVKKGTAKVRIVVTAG